MPSSSAGMELARVIVDVVRGAEPISGEVREFGQEPRRFVGYVQLIQALEDARRSAVDAIELTQRPAAG